MMDRRRFGVRALHCSLVSLLGVSSCTEESGDPVSMQPPATACTAGTPGCVGVGNPLPGAAAGGGQTGGSVGGITPGGAVSDAGVGPGNLPPSDAGRAPDASSPGAGAGGVPCAVADVISKHCAECHGQPPAFGAPMPLLTLADFQAQGFSDKTKKVHQLIPGRLAPTDSNRKMPPTSKPALSASELMTLSSWASAGAQAGSPACPISDMSTPPGADAGTAAAGSGGAHITPISYDDPDLECYNLVAYANGNKQQKYPVAAGATDAYINFYFKAPWTGDRYTRSVDIITDNKQVIHHWLLFNNRSPNLDGTVRPGLGTHGADEELLYGWAPGASPMYLDPDVGQKLEGGTGFTLEAHYNNPSLSVGPDASGAKLCVTKRVPTHEAGLSWVGTDSISGTSATGTCNPQDKEIHLIAAQPHMHKKGTHMKVTVNRKSGAKEVIHDEDFSFENQRYYPLNVVLQPGDTMTTACTYNGFATFGRGTEQEMCYFFSLHWPAGALVGGTGGLLHGGYSCL